MSIVGAIIEIFVCFWCVIGLYYGITKLLDISAAKNAPSNSVILIRQCNKGDIDYLVRFFEGRVVGELEKLVDGIAIDRNVEINNELFEKLKDEFGNIYLI